MKGVLLAQTFNYGTGVVSSNTAPFASGNGQVSVVGNSVVVTANTTIVAGTYNFENFTINSGVTLTVTGTGAPLIIRCTGTFTNNGILSANGGNGTNGTSAIANLAAGGTGVAGGTNGGVGGGLSQSNYRATRATGFGSSSGGGWQPCNSVNGTANTNGQYGAAPGGGGGYGVAGSLGGTQYSGNIGSGCATRGNGGSVYGNAELTAQAGAGTNFLSEGNTPEANRWILAGSGGGGGGGSQGIGSGGGGGGGGAGGGAIQIIANDVLIGASGIIRARGGNGGTGYAGLYGAGAGGGGGAGGTIHIASFAYTNNNANATERIDVRGGNGGSAAHSDIMGSGGNGGAGGAGRFLIDEDVLLCSAPEITADLQNIAACINGGTSIAIGVTGDEPLTYQWQLSTNGGDSWNDIIDGGNYSGASTSALNLTGLNAGMSGYQYQVNIVNDCGTATSSVAILTVQVCPANDSPLPSNPNMNAVAHYYPNLVFVQGSTTGATISAQTGTADVWYQFNAISSGVRIVVNSSVIDPVIRLCNASYEVLDTEDVVEGTGEERLNYGGLTPGQNYFIAISSANSNQGTFNLAVQKLRAPGCGTVAPYSLCTSFKSTYTGATTTQFTFTQGETTTSHTAAGPFSLGVTGLQLLHGNTYSVGLTANFELNDGNNENETIEVATVNACTITISPQPSIEVRSNQRCANGATLLRHTYLQAVPVGVSLVCGITGYQVEFTPVDNCQGDNPNPLDKITRTINGSNTSISLNNVFNGLPLSNHPHIGYWSVVYTPVFHGSILGNPSTTARVIAVNGTSTNAALSAEQSDVFNVVAGVNPIVANLYPNPNTGDMVNLNMTGITTDHVHVRIMDSMGRVVYSHRYTVDGSLNTIANFSRPLSNGIYMVEFTSGNEIITQRMMVSK